MRVECISVTRPPGAGRVVRSHHRIGFQRIDDAVQPTDTAHVLMTSVGIESSSDGGKTWHLALKSNVMFGPVAWAPSASDVAYAIGFDRSFWRSDDGGKTWAKVS